MDYHDTTKGDYIVLVFLICCMVFAFSSIFFHTTASVAAGERFSDPPIEGDFLVTDPASRSYKWYNPKTDTARYYAKVDTVGWWFTVCGDTSYHQSKATVTNPDTLNFDCSHWWPTVWPDLDTTWHPKVQVWLTENEATMFREWIISQMPCSSHGHDWYATGLGWCCATSGDYYRCSKCDKSLDVPRGKTPEQVEKTNEDLK